MALSPEQLAMRRTMVTATDSRALAGEDPNRGPFEVYVEKVSTPEPWAGNHATRIGEQLEPLALAFLAEHLDRPITPGTTERHRTIPHLGASFDGNILDTVGGRRVAVAEAKTVGLRSARHWDGRQPPDRVLVQVTKQLVVAELRVAWVVALIGTEPRFYEVELNDVLAEAITEQDDTFWREHVAPRIPPEVDGTESTKRALSQLYPRVKGDVFRAGPEVEEMARAYFTAKREADAAKTKLLAAENQLRGVIGEHEGVEGDGWKAKWGERNGSVSWKDAFAALGPKVEPSRLEEFRGAPSRSLLVTNSKGER